MGRGRSDFFSSSEDEKEKATISNQTQRKTISQPKSSSSASARDQSSASEAGTSGAAEKSSGAGDTNGSGEPTPDSDVSYSSEAESDDDEESEESSSEASSEEESSSEADSVKPAETGGNVSDSKQKLIPRKDADLKEKSEGGKRRAKKDAKSISKVSFLSLYPKSLSLVGLNDTKQEEKEEESNERRRPEPASVQGRLQTRVLRRSASLVDFTSQLQKKLEGRDAEIEPSDMSLLNRAVYEAWCFHKAEEKARLQREAEEARKNPDPRKKYKLFQPTVPRKPKLFSRNDKVKMKLDDTDPGWEWFQEKLQTMRKQEKKRKKELKEKQKEEATKKASKMEEGALAYLAWKKVKDEKLAKERRKQKQEAKERKEEEERNAEENRAITDKVVVMFRERKDAERRQVEQQRFRRQRRLRDRSALMVEERDRQALARYELWLLGAATRTEHAWQENPRSPPPPRRPWYPAGRLGSAASARSDLSTTSEPTRRSLRTVAPPRGRRAGWRPCGQTHCPACPCAEEARAVSSASRSEVLVPIGQPLTCSSQRAVFVVQCGVCGLQYVGWTLRSIRAAFSHVLNAVRSGGGGSRLARHVAHHRQESEEFIPLSDCLLLVGVRSFPDNVSKHAVQDFAFTLKDLLGTVQPEGLNTR